MKSPHELTHDQLAEIVSLVQDAMYLDVRTDRYDRDREWSGADVCQDIAAVLERFDLMPESTDDERFCTTTSK